MSFIISGVCCDNGLIDPQFIKKTIRNKATYSDVTYKVKSLCLKSTCLCVRLNVPLSHRIRTRACM